MAVTSRDIMKSLEIKNVKTLTRWHQSGVIPEPTVETHPDGVGRIACWPDWVLDHCRVIKQLTGNGQTLQQVAETFGSNWEEIARRYRQYKFSEVTKKMDLDNKFLALRESIEQELARELGDIRERLQATSIPPITRDLLSRAMELVQDGFNPVLVVTSQRLVVTPDFLVGLHLSDHFDNPKSLLVVPLYSKIKSHLGTRRMARVPMVRPASFVYRQTKEGKVEEVIELEGEWQFHLRTTEASEPKRKRK